MSEDTGLFSTFNNWYRSGMKTLSTEALAPMRYISGTHEKITGSRLKKLQGRGPRCEELVQATYDRLA